MFGYAVANIDKLTDEEMEQYRSCYCGLCKALRERHGIAGRFTLTYDMTFLVLLLTAFYKMNKREGKERCLPHPLKPHRYWASEITGYAADMNVFLAYHNLLDNWQDDQSSFSLLGAKLLAHNADVIRKKYPRKCVAIEAYLEDLAAMEKRGEMNPDLPANCFGNLMGEIIFFKEDQYSNLLKAFGSSLGKFIYIMDAAIDFKDDLKSESYNPLATRSSGDFDEILFLLMGDCAEKYKQLKLDPDLAPDKGLIENILYSGIWTRYQAAGKTDKGEQ
jgi:hypothetical protein